MASRFVTASNGKRIEIRGVPGVLEDVHEDLGEVHVPSESGGPSWMTMEGQIASHGQAMRALKRGAVEGETPLVRWTSRLMLFTVIGPLIGGLAVFVVALAYGLVTGIL
jgi:hypothetical protein